MFVWETQALTQRAPSEKAGKITFYKYFHLRGRSYFFLCLLSIIYFTAWDKCWTKLCYILDVSASLGGCRGGWTNVWLKKKQFGRLHGQSETEWRASEQPAEMRLLWSLWWRCQYRFVTFSFPSKHTNLSRCCSPSRPASLEQSHFGGRI